MTKRGVVGGEIGRTGGDFVWLARPVEQMPRPVDGARLAPCRRSDGWSVR